MEIRNREFYNKMVNILLKIPGAQIASGGKEVIMPCRYCQDKGKRMYVSLPVDSNLMLHNCYRASCGASGIVTHNKIIEWGLYENINDLEALSTYNKSVSNLSKNKKVVGKDTYKLNNTFVSQDEISDHKLKYINDRLGVNLTYDDILKLKIVINLKDILNINRITKYTRHDGIIKELDDFFIGFISKDNAFINMRNLVEGKGKVFKGIDKKYINYNIFDKFENTQRYYVIPTNIDLCNPNRVKLHIAEGPFDILSIYLNLRQREEHSIYVSILGGGYMNTIRYFISTLAIPNLEIHLYPDKDIYEGHNYYKLIKMLEMIKYSYFIPIYIHINKYPNQKDYGVSLNEIIDQVTQL